MSYYVYTPILVDAYCCDVFNTFIVNGSDLTIYNKRIDNIAAVCVKHNFITYSIDLDVEQTTKPLR